MCERNENEPSATPCKKAFSLDEKEMHLKPTITENGFM